MEIVHEGKKHQCSYCGDIFKTSHLMDSISVMPKNFLLQSYMCKFLFTLVIQTDIWYKLEATDSDAKLGNLWKIFLPKTMAKISLLTKILIAIVAGINENLIDIKSLKTQVIKLEQVKSEQKLNSLSTTIDNFSAILNFIIRFIISINHLPSYQDLKRKAYQCLEVICKYKIRDHVDNVPEHYNDFDDLFMCI